LRDSVSNLFEKLLHPNNFPAFSKRFRPFGNLCRRKSPQSLLVFLHRRESDAMFSMRPFSTRSQYRIAKIGSAVASQQNYLIDFYLLC